MNKFQEFSKEVQAVQEWLKREFSQISTGRANPALLDSILVDSYGSKQPIKSVASMSVEDARTLRISPWDKGQLKAIESAIIDSKLPVSVSVDDQGVRVSVPQMTEESRKQIAKVAKDKLEQARVRIRAEREKAIKQMESGEYSDDEKRDMKEALQKLVDKANDTAQEVYTKKEADIMSV
jgi:ribosome recycling factor